MFLYETTSSVYGVACALLGGALRNCFAIRDFVARKRNVSKQC